MKTIKVEDAVGMVLAHDLTKIVPGKFKGAAFKKGHIIQEEDIQELRSMGKNHINVVKLSTGELHEDEAAIRIANAIAGENLDMKGPAEGKITIHASIDGMLQVNIALLHQVNRLSPIIVSTRHNKSLVLADQIVASTRIIPLTIEREKIAAMEELCQIQGPLLTVKPFLSQTVGIVVTGTEVYEGTITDRFGPVIEQKARQFRAEVLPIKYAPDDADIIASRMRELHADGATILIGLGGMSVDADDVTPSAIRLLADEFVSYGAPVLPGAMLMLAYFKNRPVLGIPACGMYHNTTVFDAVFLPIMVGERISADEISEMGHGGLCLNCEVCHYPVCPFCK